MNSRAWGRLVQSVCIVALILLLGIASYALVYEAGSAYGRLTEEQSRDYNLRVASNYLTNKTHRYDCEGGISVAETPFGECLVLYEEIDGIGFETRIYLLDGMLRESFVFAGAAYDDDTAFDIVELDSFSVSGGSPIRFEIGMGGETRTVSIAPRAGGIR